MGREQNVSLKLEGHLLFLQDRNRSCRLRVQGFLPGGDRSRVEILEFGPADLDGEILGPDNLEFECPHPLPYIPLALTAREKSGILELLGLSSANPGPTFASAVEAFARYKRLAPHWRGSDLFTSSRPEVGQLIGLVRPKLGDCGHHTMAGQAICAALGVKARQLILSEVGFHSAHMHSTLEVYPEDLRRWIILDPMMGLYPVHDGRLLSLLDLWELKTMGITPEFTIASNWNRGLDIDPKQGAELNLIDRAEFLVNGPDNYFPLSDLSTDRNQWEYSFHPNAGGIGHRLFRIEKDVWMVKLVPERVKFSYYRIHNTDNAPIPLLNWQATPLGEPRPFGQLSRYRFRRNSRSIPMEIVDSRNRWSKLKPPPPRGTGIPGLPESRIYTYDGVGGLSWRFGALEGKLNQTRLKIRILAGRCRMILKSGDFIYSVFTFDSRRWSTRTVTFFGGQGETELRLETSEFARFQIGAAGQYRPSPP